MLCFDVMEDSRQSLVSRKAWLVDHLDREMSSLSPRYIFWGNPGSVSEGSMKLGRRKKSKESRCCHQPTSLFPSLGLMPRAQGFVEYLQCAVHRGIQPELSRKEKNRTNWSHEMPCSPYARRGFDLRLRLFLAREL